MSSKTSLIVAAALSSDHVGALQMQTQIQTESWTQMNRNWEERKKKLVNDAKSSKLSPNEFWEELLGKQETFLRKTFLEDKKDEFLAAVLSNSSRNVEKDSKYDEDLLKKRKEQHLDKNKQQKMKQLKLEKNLAMMK